MQELELRCQPHLACIRGEENSVRGSADGDVAGSGSTLEVSVLASPEMAIPSVPLTKSAMVSLPAAVHRASLRS